MKSDKQRSGESNFAFLQQKSPAALLAELECIIANAPEEELDAELIEAYLSVLDEKAPLPEDFDAERSYQRFGQRYAHQLEHFAPKLASSASRNRSWLRLVYTAAVICLLLLSGTIIAEACGVDVFAMLNASPDSADAAEASGSEATGQPAAYQDVLDSILAQKAEPGVLGQQAGDVLNPGEAEVLYDVNEDGQEELLVFYYQGEYAFIEVWRQEEDTVQLAARKQLFLLAGGLSYGGAAIAELDGASYLCLWYTSPHSGDAEYNWFTDEYILLDRNDLTEAAVFYGDYAVAYATGALYEGDFDYVFQRDGQDITEGEFAAVKDELEGSMTALVGIFEGCYDEYYNLTPIGTPLDSLL